MTGPGPDDPRPDAAEPPVPDPGDPRPDAAEPPVPDPGDPRPDAAEPPPPDPDDPAGPAPKDRDAWKLVYFGQISRDLVPYHPEPPEAPEDELTRAALEDPDSVTRGEAPNLGPTFWRVLVVVAIAVGALALVFWRSR